MKFSESPICRECERLWQTYQRVTNEHLRLVATLSLPTQNPEGLIQKINDAEFARRTAREALETHRLHTGHQ
jgi:hypothetical protein